MSACRKDPVFDLIATVRKTKKARNIAYDRAERAEFRARKKHGYRPIALIAWRYYSAIGGSEIDRARLEFLQLPGANPEKIAAEYRDAQDRYSRAVRAGPAWDKKAGLVQFRKAVGSAIAADEKAIEKFSKARPVTLAGAATMIDFIVADSEAGEMDWHKVGLAGVAEALRAMEGAK
jgi:hypothetical protein